MATTKCTTWWGVSMPGRGPSIRPFLFTSLLAACAAAHAEDLLQVYRDAQRYDAVYASARQSLVAGRERIPQGRALLLPSLNLTASAGIQRVDVTSSNTAVTPSFVRNPTT